VPWLILLLALVVPGFSEPKVRMLDPVVVTMGPAEEKRWGFYQFPHIERWADGRIAVRFSVHPDAAESYGLAATVPNLYVSSDEGRTWQPHTGQSPSGGLELPNGDRLSVSMPRPVPVSELQLPQSVGTRTGTYRGEAYTLYRLAELPRRLQGVYFSRLARGGNSWIEEQSDLRDPEALRYALRGIFPVFWSGDIRIERSGALVAGIYPGYLEEQTNHPSNIFFYASSDNGRSWDVRGRIRYEPDLQADPRGGERDGFTEPAFIILADGSLLCVMRTTDGLGVGPMYASRSSDGGKSWTKPAAFARTGVLPRLLLLENGTLVLTAGRPGVDLRLSPDGRGTSWTDPVQLVPVTSEQLGADSCGYTDLLATGRDSFLIAYSWFKAKDGEGRERKTIFVRRVEVER
jgi:hypothetical protein